METHTLDQAKANLEEVGFLNIPTTGIDYVAEINKLRKEKNAVILAHYYQEDAIQDIADFVGDSLQLAQEAAKTDADIIVFAGVHFMAETAKILNPGKKVLMPDSLAGCSLADSCPPALFAKFKEEHPNHTVISYINCTAGIKAQSDIICTSSNSVKIVESLPKDEKIIFAPDRNLGRYVMEKTGREMVLWNGTCMVHEIFSMEKISKLKHRYPNAKLIAHPECEAHILDQADFIGSTTGLLNYTQQDSNNTYIVATETGIIHQMKKRSPEKTFIPAPPDNLCACNDCPHMKRNTMEKLYTAIRYELPEITMDAELMNQARKPIQRMLDLSASLGL